eukprot:102880-Alexandrium_andersonii.AAC.1
MCIPWPLADDLRLAVSGPNAVVHFQDGLATTRRFITTIGGRSASAKSVVVPNCPRWRKIFCGI